MSIIRRVSSLIADAFGNPTLTATNSNGYGIQGVADNGASAAGVYGSSSSGIGVRGVCTASDGTAVYGTANTGSNATGVYGDSSSGYGVQGVSSASGGTGVYGLAGNGATAVGVFGETSSGIGVKGVGNGGNTVGGDFTGDGTGTAIVGRQTASGYVLSLVCDTTSPVKAPLHIDTQNAVPTGAHVVGDFYVPSSGQLRGCVVAGTPGTWSGVANQDRPVVLKDANYQVLVTDVNTLFTNETAAGDVTFTLPAAAAGLHFTFYVQVAENLIVLTTAGDTIRIAANETAVSGFVESAVVGSCVRLVCINATEWITESVVGTWAVT